MHVDMKQDSAETYKQLKLRIDMSVPNEEFSTPTLYKLDSKGVTRVWRSWSTLQEDGTAVENNESGIEGGTLSGIPMTVLTGKNIGKKNETTPLQQVNKKIASKYTKKLREGYVLDLSEFTQKGVMSAHEWKVSKHRMSQIALHQPKLDGIRCKPIKDSEGNLTLMSKSNKEFKNFLYDTPWANHFRHELRPGEEVDGEMYIHGLELNEIASLVMSYKLNQGELLDFCEDTDEGLKISLPSKKILDLVYVGRFQPERHLKLVEKVETAVEGGVEIQVIVSSKLMPTDQFHESMGAIEVGKNKGWILPNYCIEDVEVLGTSDLEFWAFDIPDLETMAEERNANLSSRWGDTHSLEHKIIAVIAEEFDTDNIEEVNADHVSRGFEGTMVRLPSGLYAFGERSAALQKYKLFHDAEWIITGYSLDAEGNPTFTFVSDAGITFSSRPTGNRAWRARLLEDMDQLIGRPATLRYQMLYRDSLCPQFSRVIAVRDYE